MLRLVKRFFPREPLPSHVHFHIDSGGESVLCDESICRPERRPPAPLLLPLR